MTPDRMGISARRWTLRGSLAFGADDPVTVVEDGPGLSAGEAVEVVEAEPSPTRGAVEDDAALIAAVLNTGQWRHLSDREKATEYRQRQACDVIETVRLADHQRGAV